jgi:hypothetical protein
MPSASAVPFIIPQYFDNNGDPLAAGYLYTYAAGTSTSLASYSDPAGTIPNTNPVVLDSAGRKRVYLLDSALYKLELRDSLNAVIWSEDNIEPSGYRTAQLAGTTGSSLVGFLQSGVGASPRTAQEKLREFVSLADFGAVGDGVVNDRAAIVNALNSARPILWVGTTGNTFKISSSINHTFVLPITWEGRGASLVYAGSHAEFALRLNATAGGLIQVSNLTIDGAKLCNKPLEILNNTNMTSASSIYAVNLFVKRAKRSNAFSGGDGMNVRGAFSIINMLGGGSSDCELPAGQGTPSVVGITGMAFTHYSATAYIERVVLSNVTIEKIYSSDAGYMSDQDGLLYFSADDPIGIFKQPSQLVVGDNCKFINCYGRSIKTQIKDTIVRDSTFVRTEGPTSGNVEINAQSGAATLLTCVFKYSSGFQPNVLFASSAAPLYGRASMVAKSNNVYLDAATTLNTFAQPFASLGPFSKIDIDGNNIYGKIKEFVGGYFSTTQNYLSVTNNYVEELVNGTTGQKALIYVRSGAIAPFGAKVTAAGNVYGGGALPAVMRDSIPGNSMSALLSAYGNYGFADNAVVSPAVSGLHENPISRIEKLGALTGAGYLRITPFTVAATGTVTVNLGNIQGAFVLIQLQYSTTTWVLFSSSPTINTSIATGAGFGLGNVADPGTGAFRVWSSAPNVLTISNTTGSARLGVAMVLSPGA